MKTTFIIIVLTLLGVSLFSQDQRPAYDGTITDLVVKGNFEVILFQSDVEDLYIHAPVNIQRNIKSECKDGVFTISNNNLTGTPAKLYLVVKDLKSIRATGSVTITTPTNIYTKYLSVYCSEEVSANLYISSEDLTFIAQGDGQINVSGEIDTLRLKAEDSSNLTFDIKSHKVYANMREESEVTFEGSIFKLFSDNYNYSITENTNSVTGTCNINTNDNSLARIKAEDKLFLHAYGKSTIVYKGNGKVETAEKEKKASIKPESKTKALVITK